jgi:hypothetical protein
MGIDFEQIKQSAKAMWSLGDYSLFTKQLEPAALDLVEVCGISPEQEVLDVAAGNGNCAATENPASVIDVPTTDTEPVTWSVRPTASPRCPNRTSFTR